MWGPFHLISIPFWIVAALLEHGSFDQMKMVRRTQCDSYPAEKRRETIAHPALIKLVVHTSEISFLRRVFKARPLVF